jgi:hypothetical protein
VLKQQGHARQRRYFEYQRPSAQIRASCIFLLSPIGQKVGLWLQLFQDGETPMKKFLALYMADALGMADMMKNSTPEQRKKGTEAWEKWMGDNRPR